MPTSPISSKLVTTSGVGITTCESFTCYLNNHKSAVLFGPEVNIKVLGDQFGDIHWSGMGVGFGVRGSRREDITIQFESKIMLLSDM